MQIHELTKLQRTDEGLLDGVKAAIGAAKTGASNGGGAGGAIKALTSPKAYQQARNDVYAADSKKKLASIAKDMNKGKKPGDPGYWIPPGEKGYDEQQAAKALAKNPKAAQKVDQYTTAFQDTFGVYDPSTGQHSQANTVLPEPNKTLMVTASNGGNYYKAINGKWYSEKGEVIPDPTALEKMISADQYKQVGVPGVIQAKLKAISPVAPTPPAATIKEAPEYTSPGGIAIPAGAKTATPSNHLPLSKFSQWANAKVPELKGAEQDPALKPDVLAIEKSTDVKKATSIFKKLMTKVLSTTDSTFGDQGNNPGSGLGMPPSQFSNIVTTKGSQGLIAALRDDPPTRPSGSKTLDNFLQQAHLLEAELQAFKAGK